MATIGNSSRCSFALSLLLALFLFCHRTNAFTATNTKNGVTPSLQKSMHHKPLLPFQVSSPVPLQASVTNDDRQPRDSRGNNDDESSKLAAGSWWKKNPWRLFVRMSLALKSGSLRKRLRKHTVALFFMLAVMTYRLGVLPANTSTTTLEEPAAVVVQNEDRAEDLEPEKSSSGVGKASATAVLVASGAHVVRLNRKQKRQNKEALAEFESWNASWNATEPPPNGQPKVAVRVNGNSYPNAERMDLLSTATNSTTWNVVEMLDSCSSTFSSPPPAAAGSAEEKDDVMKATVEAMKRAGGESTELVQTSNVQEPIKESLEPATESKSILEEASSSVQEVVGDSSAPVNDNNDPYEPEDRAKYPKERMPILDPAERAKVQAKYAAIDSLEDRAFQILLDLGMIERNE